MSFKCEYCGRKFDTQQGLNVHIGKKHPEKNKNVECDYCGKEFHKRPSKKDRSKFCSKECFNKWRSENIKGKNHPSYKPNVTKTCKQCGKKFQVIPSRKDTARFCSKECYSKWQSDNIEGEKNPFWKEKITKTCKQCKEKFKVYPYRKDTSKFCSENCYYKWQSEHNNKWDKEKIIRELRKFKKEIGHSPTINELKKRGREDLLGACWMHFNSFNSAKKEAGLKTSEDIRYKRRTRKKIIKSLMERPTKPEQRVIDIIKKYSLNWRYVGDGKKFIGDLNPDFVHNNGSKKVIEVYGDYWHSGERVNDWKRTEFGRKAYFSQFGYDTLILWTSEMEEMSDGEIMGEINEI